MPFAKSSIRGKKEERSQGSCSTLSADATEKKSHTIGNTSVFRGPWGERGPLPTPPTVAPLCLASLGTGPCHKISKWANVDCKAIKPFCPLEGLWGIKMENWPATIDKRQSETEQATCLKENPARNFKKKRGGRIKQNRKEGRERLKS